MSKPWNPRLIEVGRPRRGTGRRWRGWASRRRLAFRASAREIRLALLGGALAGLVYTALPSGSAENGDPFGGAPPAAVDPWAESRRSMEILAAQEAAPEAGQRAEAGPTAEATGGAPLALVRVIDGDTFAYGGVKVRIADIDTPELQGRCPHESRLAEQAAVRLQGLLAEGPFDLERVERDEDRFGRKLRLVTRGGESLGATLVAEGLARPWDGARRSWCG